jgi:transposase
VSNVLSEEKKKQVIALGQLGWSLRQIQKHTGVRRETAGEYLKAAGVGVRPPGSWGKKAPAKPANEVTTDPPEAKPANGMTTDYVADIAAEQPPPPAPAPSAASVSEPYRELILNGLARGRNAMSIFQEMVDRHGFPGAYESVKRFVRKLRGPASPDPRAVIITEPGQDYGKFRVMVRGGADSSVLTENLRRDSRWYIT